MFSRTLINKTKVLSNAFAGKSINQYSIFHLNQCLQTNTNGAVTFYQVQRSFAGWSSNFISMNEIKL